MSIPAQPSARRRWPYSSSDEAPQVAQFHRLLPSMLSGVAGMVDVIGFLTLGLFTAHVTGNLVVIAASLARGGPPNIAQVLAIPVFMAAVAAVWLIAKASNRRGPALAKLLLAVHFLLLICVLIFSVVYDPAVDPHGLMATIAAMMAVSAMACQFALLRLAVPGAPSTAVMTGNLTSGVLSLLDTLSRGEPLIDGAKERLRKTVELVGGFCSGCVVGAAAVSWLGWAWSLPVALAGVAMALQSTQEVRMLRILVLFCSGYLIHMGTSYAQVTQEETLSGPDSHETVQGPYSPSGRLGWRTVAPVGTWRSVRFPIHL